MPVYEVAVAARDFGPGRAQEGDIIAVRTPIGRVGKKEQNDFIWFLMESELTPAELMAEGEGTKRKYAVNLADIDENIDLEKARDPQQTYQPFFSVDTRSGALSTARAAKKGLTLRDRNQAKLASK